MRENQQHQEARCDRAENAVMALRHKAFHSIIIYEMRARGARPGVLKTLRQFLYAAVGMGKLFRKGC